MAIESGPQLAFIFPGQGTQGHVPEMAKRLLFHKTPEFALIANRTYEEADDTLEFGLRDLSLKGSTEMLGRPGFTEPVILTASIAALRVLRERGINPDIVAGHSMGELSALVAGEALSFEQALKLVRARGQFMEAAAKQNPGGMVAILGLSLSEVEDVCRGLQAYPANINGFKNIVVSGDNEGVKKVSSAVNALGKKAIPLEVTVPAHSPLMEPARIEMERLLGDYLISDLSLPLIMNVNAEYAMNPEEVRIELVDQMTKGVLWLNMVEQMAADGVGESIEVGPGGVLSNTIKRIDPSIHTSHAMDLISSL